MTPRGPIGSMLTFNHIPKFGALPLITAVPQVWTLFSNSNLFSTKPQISWQNENSVFGQLQRLDFYKKFNILHGCKRDREKDVGGEGEEIEIY